MRTWSKERRLVAVCPVINRVRVSTRSLSTRVRLPFPVLTSMKTLLTQAASTCGGGRSGLEASREVECDELRAVGDDPMRPGRPRRGSIRGASGCGRTDRGAWRRRFRSFPVPCYVTTKEDRSTSQQLCFGTRLTSHEMESRNLLLNDHKQVLQRTCSVDHYFTESKQLKAPI